MDDARKRFRDSRLDALKSHVDVFGKKSLDLMKKMEQVGFTHSKTGSRFGKHGLSGPTSVLGNASSLVQSRKSLLDGSIREHIAQKKPDDENSFEKHLRRVKEAFRRNL
ncbi:MAG: hypothetical protein FJY77_02885 [Candidatus Altiarchaeales archaeon]|nr:hypothetical protein [Candidatus Altiarchaeales archaeon]